MKEQGDKIKEKSTTADCEEAPDKLRIRGGTSPRTLPEPSEHNRTPEAEYNGVCACARACVWLVPCIALQFVLLSGVSECVCACGDTCQC